MKKITLILFSLFITNAFANDLIALNNGMLFSGHVKKIKHCLVVFKADNDKKYIVPLSEVYSIEFKDENSKALKNYLQTKDTDKCLDAKRDAKVYHGKKGTHFALGALFGPFSMAGTLIANPKPQRGKHKADNPNKAVFDNPEYLQCYKKAATWQLIKMEALGWGTWILIALIFL